MHYVRLGEADIKNNINNKIFVTFIARDVSVRLQKDKVTHFISLNMVDKDVTVDAKLFGAKKEHIDMINNGKVFNAAVDVKAYDKSTTGFSCIIYNIEESTCPPEYFVDWAEDLPGSKKIIENALGEIINTIYGQIAYPIVVKYWDKFYIWSAAKGQHHTQLGGLFTHTAEVIKLVDDVSDFFNSKYGDDFINKPLLLAAAVLHDLGKVKELNVNSSNGNTEYSSCAALSTHIMDMLNEISIQAYRLGFGEQEMEVNELGEEEFCKSEEQLNDEIEQVLLLKHTIAAHHGKLEWGSPIKPSIPEAYILHMIDTMDAEMYRFNRSFKNISSGEHESVWTNDGFKNTYKERSK